MQSNEVDEMLLESADDEITARAIERRRTFHRYPEPAWCEFQTTSRLVDAVEEIGVDEYFVGTDVLESDERLGVPKQAVREQWRTRAAEAGARSDVLDATAGGETGAVAVLDRGTGPVVGLRVDIDALPIEETMESAHAPVAAGFRSDHEGTMHACGHDAHMAIGLGVLERIAASSFDGVFKLFFQPAEEVLGGGKPMAGTDHVRDIDQFFALHVGLGHPTGTVVAGSNKPLAVRQSQAVFTGKSAHAGLEPQNGRNAMQAMAAAIQNIYGISRHADDLTRVNVGQARAGSASNVVAPEAMIDLEARAGSNDVLEYVTGEVDRVLTAAAEMHDCAVTTTLEGQAPRVDSDPELAALVEDVARDVSGVKQAIRHAEFGASEDATYFMRRVAQNGGEATFVLVGTDHPSGHHTETFDVDETSIDIGIDVLSNAIRRALNAKH